MRFLCVTAALAAVSCTFDYQALEGTPGPNDASLDTTTPPAADAADAADAPEGRDIAGRIDQTTPDAPLLADLGSGVDHQSTFPLDTGAATDVANGSDVGSGGIDGAVGSGGAISTGGALGTGGLPGSGGASARGGAPGTGGAIGTGGPVATGGTAVAGGTMGTGGAVGSGGVWGTGGASTGGVVGTGGSTITEPPSCQGQSFRCGAANESCCTTIHLPGGTFPMGRGAGTDAYGGRANELPEHSATVAPFSLDKYEVTVGRLKVFLADFDRWRQAGNPTLNAGANPNLTGAASGWPSDASLRTNAADLAGALRCATDEQTIDAGNDAFPANCITYYESFAFCIWDGGRLPTEAEWELAAAGGEENRLYPWGAAAADSTHANFTGCAGCAASPKVVVGSYPAGVGRWGHLDLAGSMWEWVIDWYQSDWYSSGGATCNNCANLTTQTYRVIKGSSWSDPASDIRAAFRGYTYSTTHYQYRGVRCARDP
jgi:formylglycine-generating enzyme